MRVPVDAVPRCPLGRLMALAAIGLAAAAAQGDAPPRPGAPPEAAVCSATGVGPWLTEGDRAERTLRCPEPITVVDVERTVQAAANRAEVLPVVFRVVQGRIDEAMDRAHGDFASARARFLDLLEAETGARLHPDGSLPSVRLVSVVETFRFRDREFPVSFALAQQWAAGGDGGAILRRMTQALRRISSADLVGELPPASTMFVVAVGEDEPVRRWGAVAGLSRIAEPGSIVPMDVAALRLRAMLGDDDREMGGYLAGIVRPTLVVDEHLTGLLFLERVGTGLEARRYSRGEVIVPAGGAVDRWAAIALAHLRRAGLEPASEPLERATDRWSPPAEGGARAEQRRWSWPGGAAWWVVALCGAGVAGAGIVLSVRRRRARRPSWLATQTPAGPDGLRTALLPHLAREMKDRLVHVLFAQRSELLMQEADAARRVEELEARLARLQPAFAARVRAYEERIRMLEKQLEERDEETRELIRAKLVLAREELAEEVARNRIRWN